MQSSKCIRMARRCLSTLNNVFSISKEVKDAILNRKAILALESTIVTHGMPYPINFNTAMEVERIVRENAVIPATIGVVNGIIKVGLSSDELNFLAKSTQVVKISRRDLPFVVTKALSGGTTVSATMAIAHRAGIKCFATGGIGGVHRGAEITFDISADLRELGRTPIAVFSSGIKSILDIEKTLEYLETEGVAVTVFTENGKENETDFPAFYTSKSDFKVNYSVKSVQEAAELIYKHEILQLVNSILIAVPVPEEFSLSKSSIDKSIEGALEEAKVRNIKGKDITPFVLSKVTELSKGDSLQTNVALIKNNARVGSQIALYYQKLKNEHSSNDYSDKVGLVSKKRNLLPKYDIVVVGASMIDVMLSVNSENLSFDGTTVSASTNVTMGGVGRNLAHCLSKLGHNVLLLSAVGDDQNGKMILSKLSEMDLSGVNILQTTSTSTMYAIMNHGESKLLIGSVEANRHISVDHVSKFADHFTKAAFVMIDANIPIFTAEYVLNLCYEKGVPVFYEPTDPRLAANILKIDSECKNCLTFASPNLMELKAICEQLDDQNFASIDSISELKEICLNYGKKVVPNNFETLLVTLGSKGVILLTGKNPQDFVKTGPGLDFNKHDNFKIHLQHFPAQQVRETEIISSLGAGDCFASAFVSALTKRRSLAESIRFAMTAATLSLKSKDTVPDSLSNLKNYFN
ncbi:uncharacterized protein B4U79_07770 [Dinothrombium tinctorium]|uniref:Carbohydrate kinase PfkB domain-containing protein n=1 Tax=Dinothrombium tinctorium TaxID=1965070 RepID=A0A3S3Q559_9ACAR|nr:uncharacterized protein B4U79_12808 [Dinothrombium tinctorium]RWS14189.1 uncharacterized protein B4U79_00800 [Dinothrombium tinctorium]RWS14708.1 uncharacterized protein B4U79_07770 [Dinothrombium tinctorium]